MVKGNWQFVNIKQSNRKTVQYISCKLPHPATDSDTVGYCGYELQNTEILFVPHEPSSQEILNKAYKA